MAFRRLQQVGQDSLEESQTILSICISLDLRMRLAAPGVGKSRWISDLWRSCSITMVSCEVLLSWTHQACEWSSCGSRPWTNLTLALLCNSHLCRSSLCSLCRSGEFPLQVLRGSITCYLIRLTRGSPHSHHTPPRLNLAYLKITCIEQLPPLVPSQMEQPPAGRGSKQPEDNDDVAKIDPPVPVPQIRRHRRNAFGALTAPASRPDDTEGPPAIPVAYPPVRPATPGTCRTAHIAAQGSAKSKRLSSGSSPGEALTPLRTRVSSPPFRGSLVSPRQPPGPEVQLPYSYPQPDAATEAFPAFVDIIEIPTFEELQASKSNAEGPVGRNASPPSSTASRRRSGAISRASHEATVPTPESSSAPTYRQRASSRSVTGNALPKDLFSDANPAPPRH